MSSTDPSPVARRIVGVVADVDDENIAGQAALTIYRPFQYLIAGRLFGRTARDPYALVPVRTMPRGAWLTLMRIGQARLLLILTSDTNIATVISSVDMRLGRLERTPCSCRSDPATAAA
jgi:hypothetical protein